MSQWIGEAWNDSMCASYDRWKLASPYDYEDVDEPDYEDCDHEDLEVDWQGEAQCHRCGAMWHMTSAELASWNREERKRARAFHWTMWREGWADWFRSWMFALVWRHFPTRNEDEEIPF